MESANELWLCNNCGTVKLDTTGRCEHCGSDAVAPVMATKIKSEPEKEN